MLLPSDRAALRGSRLLPHASNAIASVAGCRGVVIARSTFATYQNITGGNVTVMAVTLPGGTFQIGDQIRLTMVGSAINNSGSSQLVGATLRFTQGVNVQNYGNFGTTASLGTAPYPWKSDILVAASLTGADGQYLSENSKDVVPSQIAARIPNSTNMAFTGGGTTIVGTNAGTSTFARGTFAAGSTISSTFAQTIIAIDQPILVEAVVGDVSGTTYSVTVQSGLIECL